MGLLKAFKRLWRAFHPQYRAMSQSEIQAMDRAVADSMAKGSFGTRRPDPVAGPAPTADELWSAVPAVVAPVPAMPPASDRHMSLSSHRSAGRLSVSSRGHDSGFAEGYYRPASSRRQYLGVPQQYPLRDAQQGYYQQDAYWSREHEQYQPYEYEEEYEQYHYDQGQAYYDQQPEYADGYHHGHYGHDEAVYDAVPGRMVNSHY